MASTAIYRTRCFLFDSSETFKRATTRPFLKFLATKLYSSNLLSPSKWKQNLSSEGGDTAQKGNDLLVALQTEIEADNSKVIKLIKILKDIPEYQAIGKQLEGKISTLHSKSYELLTYYTLILVNSGHTDLHIHVLSVQILVQDLYNRYTQTFVAMVMNPHQ